jgi:hypothetical protein
MSLAPEPTWRAFLPHIPVMPSACSRIILRTSPRHNRTTGNRSAETTATPNPAHRTARQHQMVTRLRPATPPPAASQTLKARRRGASLLKARRSLLSPAGAPGSNGSSSPPTATGRRVASSAGEAASARAGASARCGRSWGLHRKEGDQRPDASDAQSFQNAPLPPHLPCPPPSAASPGRDGLLLGSSGRRGEPLQPGHAGGSVVGIEQAGSR